MTNQNHAAIAAAAVIIIWTATASFAAFASPTENLPMSLSNTLTLVAVGSMLLMLFARALTARPPHAQSEEHIIPADRPGMNAKDLGIVLLSGAACGYALLVNIFSLGPEPGSLHWLASAYAGHASLLHITIYWFQRKSRTPQAKGVTP